MCCNPLISIILPCYNHGEFISDAIESILSQTYTNYELIVIENGSVDNSREIIRAYESKIDKVIYNDINDCLIYTTCNEYCSGKLIAFMCSDDFWEPQKLEKQVKMINENPECGAYFTWAKYTMADLSIESEERCFFEQKNKKDRYSWLKYFWHTGNCLAFPSAIVWKEDWSEFCRDTNSFRQVWDWYAWLRILLKKDICILQEQLVRMRRHGKNDSVLNENTKCRTINEEAFIRSDILQRLSDEDFVRVFSDYTIKKGELTHDEIVCEKIFLMFRKSIDNVFFQSEALHYYYQSYKDIRISSTMKQVYHLQMVDFDVYTGSIGTYILYCKAAAIQKQNEILKQNIKENNEDSKDTFEQTRKDILAMKDKLLTVICNPNAQIEQLRNIKDCCIEIVESCFDIWDYMERYHYDLTITEMQNLVSQWNEMVNQNNGDNLRDSLYRSMNELFQFFEKVDIE